MIDEDFKKMQELEDELCKHCPWTNYGETSSSVHTPDGVIMCEGSHCEKAYENYLEEHEDEEPEETDWRDDYTKWRAGEK